MLGLGLFLSAMAAMLPVPGWPYQVATMMLWIVLMINLIVALDDNLFTELVKKELSDRPRIKHQAMLENLALMFPLGCLMISMVISESYLLLFGYLSILPIVLNKFK